MNNAAWFDDPPRVEAVARALCLHKGDPDCREACELCDAQARAALAVVQPEIDRLREAFWIYVREQNGCSNHECAGIDTEKCGCAMEARDALAQREAEGRTDD